MIPFTPILSTDEVMIIPLEKPVHNRNSTTTSFLSLVHPSAQITATGATLIRTTYQIYSATSTSACIYWLKKNSLKIPMLVI